MHELDTILQTACPTLMVPKFGELEPLTESGHRYLSASDGLWINVKRPWLSLVWPVAQQNEFAMPYGSLEKKIQLSFDKISKEYTDLFLADATAALPNEFGAWLVWDEIEQTLKYRPLKSIEAGPDHLKVERIDLADHESLAVDLHSHAYDNAYFSTIDDEDDRGEVKISGVFGNLDLDRPTMIFRLCTGGRYIDIGTGQIKRREETGLV